MSFSYNREAYLQLLEEARNTLKATVVTPVVVVEEEEPDVVDDIVDLRDDARALVFHFDGNRDLYGVQTLEKMKLLEGRIGELQPGEADIEDHVEALRLELDAAAEWYDVHLPSWEDDDVEPEEDDDEDEPEIVRAIRAAPNVLDKVSIEELVNYNLGRALFHPEGRSAYHQRQRPLTLATASLAAAAFGRSRDADPGPAEPAPSGPIPPQPPSSGPTLPPTPPVAAPPAIDPDPPSAPNDELFELIARDIGGGLPAQRELRNLFAKIGVTSLETLIGVAADAPAGIHPGTHLRELLVGVADPRRHAHIPSEGALDKLVQAALAEISK